MESVAEIWKEIPGFEGLYEVSNRGRVKSVAKTVFYKNGRKRFQNEKIMSPGISEGYFNTCLSKGKASRTTFTIHRLVMLAFSGRPGPGIEVNHIDGNKLNNSLENLEYVSQEENIRHAMATGLYDPVGEDSPQARYSESDIRSSYNLVSSGYSVKYASSITGVSVNALRDVCRGKSWKSLRLPVITGRKYPSKIIKSSTK